MFYRDVSSVEFLIKYHQDLKAEIEARNTSYCSCVDLGETLLARNHPASEEVNTGYREVVWSTMGMSRLVADGSADPAAGNAVACILTACDGVEIKAVSTKGERIQETTGYPNNSDTTPKGVGAIKKMYNG